MAMPSGAPDLPLDDGCAGLRQEVTGRCQEARTAAQAQATAADGMRARKRDVVAAQHQVQTALVAGDPELRRADKAAARDAYRLAMNLAATDAERMEAAAAWAGAIDRINRQGRLAARAVARARAALANAEEAAQAAQRAEQALRFAAEAAQAACLEGRVRLAACEEGLADTGPRPAPPSRSHAGTAGHAVGLGGMGKAGTLVIDAILGGDEAALEQAIVVIAERAALSPAEVRLQLRELVDGLVAVAGEEGYLVFDMRYPLWAQLTEEESRDVINALGRLGFQLEPHEGWHNGRQPGSADLTMALGYAGLDARNLRTLPSSTDLSAMPASIGVDARAFLVARAPELAVDQLVRLLGTRAASLGALWDAWGQVRPVLFSQLRPVEVGERATTV